MAVLEDRDVAAFPQEDADRIFLPFSPIVFFELVTQAARFYPNDGVDARIECFPAVEYFQADQVLF